MPQSAALTQSIYVGQDTVESDAASSTAAHEQRPASLQYHGSGGYHGGAKPLIFERFLSIGFMTEWRAHRSRRSNCGRIDADFAAGLPPVRRRRILSVLQKRKQVNWIKRTRPPAIVRNFPSRPDLLALCGRACSYLQMRWKKIQLGCTLNKWAAARWSPPQAAASNCMP